MVVHHSFSAFNPDLSDFNPDLSDFNPDPLFFHHYNFFKELLFVDTKIRYYFHSVKSFFWIFIEG